MAAALAFCHVKPDQGMPCQARPNQYKFHKMKVKMSLKWDI